MADTKSDGVTAPISGLLDPGAAGKMKWQDFTTKLYDPTGQYANGMALSTYWADRGVNPQDMYNYFTSLPEDEQIMVSQSSDPWKTIADRYNAAGGKKWQDDANNKAAQAAKDKEFGDQLAKFVASYRTSIYDVSGKIIDPIALQMTKSAAGLGAQAAYGAGGEGGMTGAAAQQNAQGALNQYEQYRQQMAMQGLGLQNNRDLSLRSLQEQGRQFDAGAAMQDQANQYNQNKSIGSLIGGIGGAVAGGIATIATGGAAAPLIPGLMAGGSALGGGLGGMTVPSSGASYRPSAGTGGGGYRPGGG